MNTPKSYHCECRSGFQLHNRKECQGEETEKEKKNNPRTFFSSLKSSLTNVQTWMNVKLLESVHKLALIDLAPTNATALTVTKRSF